MSPVIRQTARRHSGSEEPVGERERTDYVSRAYRQLRHLIVWGQLPPGARISERVVAERLSLSRTPVRSAIHRLEQEGFVAPHGRGRRRHLIVAPLTMSDGQEVLFIVGHLEGLAARTAALLPEPKRAVIVRRLRAINDKLARQARTDADAARFFDLDIEFHRSYVEGVVGPRLLALHRAIKPQSERYIRLYVSVFVDAIETSVHEHEKIIRAIARADAAVAQKSAETNWHNAAARLARVIEQHGERGSWHLGEVLSSAASDRPEHRRSRGAVRGRS